MTLKLWLEHPDIGIASPLVTAGTIAHDIDYYPRASLRATIRPDPDGIPLWATPFGTRAYVGDAATGALVFSGDVVSSTVSRPEGGWEVHASDDSNRMAHARIDDRPQYLAPGVVDVATFIRDLASHVGVSVSVGGDGLGSVDTRALDLGGKNAWALVEEQLTANGLDVAVGGDSLLTVQPLPAIKDVPDADLRVGESGTITGYLLSMSRRYNRVALAHRAQKQGEDDRYVVGVWEDRQSLSGVQAIGPITHTETTRVGEDWWDDPAGHQAQADHNAAMLASAVGGTSRTATINAVPDETLRPGMTVQVTFLGGRADRFLIHSVALPLERGGQMTVGCQNPEPDWAGASLLRTTRRPRARHHT